MHYNRHLKSIRIVLNTRRLEDSRTRTIVDQEELVRGCSSLLSIHSIYIQRVENTTSKIVLNTRRLEGSRTRELEQWTAPPRTRTIAEDQERRTRKGRQSVEDSTELMAEGRGLEQWQIRRLSARIYPSEAPLGAHSGAR